jgi:hypothetical protein
VLHACKDSLIAEGVLHTELSRHTPNILLPCASGSLGCCEGTSYVDDCVFAIINASQEALIEQLQRAGKIVSDTFARHAFVLNFGPGKTEAVIALRGKGAKAIKLTFSIVKGPRSVSIRKHTVRCA